MSGALGRLPFPTQQPTDSPLAGVQQLRTVARALNPASPIATGVPDLAARALAPNPSSPSIPSNPINSPQAANTNVLAQAAPQAAPNVLASAAAPATAPAVQSPPAAPQATPGVADRVSTRIPTAKGLDYDPHARSDMKIDLEAAKSHPESYAKNSALIAEQPGMNTSRLRSPDAISNRFVQHLKDNILHIHDTMKEQMPEVVERAKHWYDGANGIAKKMSEQYGYSHRQMAGTLAALSPQKDWYQNVDLARRVLDTVTKHADKPATPEMQRWGKNYVTQMSKDAETPKASVQRFDKALQAIGNKPLNQVTDPYDRAVWVRMHDEAHNPRHYRVVTPEGDLGEVAKTKTGAPTRVTWGSFNEIGKALKVLDSDTKENISGSLGGAHKVRNFYNNIISPNASNGDITVDTHAIAGALMRPLGGSTRHVAQGLGTGGNVSSVASTGLRGLYAHYADAYRQAAAERGLLPRQMQSITWEGTRGMFSPEQRRNDTFTKSIDDLWRQHAKGKVDATTTRRSIVDAAGGIRAPEWYRARSGAGDDAQG